MWGKYALVLALALPMEAVFAVDVQPGEVVTATVKYVKDGDTFVVNEGQDVRFVDINTPEGPHDGAPAEPFAEAARARVKALATGRTVKLKIADKAYDRYGRWLADIYLPDGTWLNGLLVREGLAHVYTFADNTMHPDQLLKFEQEARAANRGIWSHPRWRVKDAAACCAPEFIGIFQVVQGKVLSTGQGKKAMYFNFGTDYHTDFTAVIEKKNLKNFKKAGIDPLAVYAGKTLRLHGFTDPVEGVEMRLTHPAQIEVVN
ncbi:MAG TPA: thermonuclease family protein [Alphaproteobacteria bacterium]|nr:thermonuclease family protein [Alphaproteobacteria bacterium]